MGTTKSALLVLAIGASFATRTATATESGPQSVWFSPSDAADLNELFTEPQLWPIARKSVNVFKLPVQWYQTGSAGLAQLVSVNAFATLKSFGIEMAVEAPSVKPWDCVGNVALAQTEEAIANIKANGNAAQYIAMDEPLYAGTMSCQLTLQQTAQNVANYIKALRSHAADQPPGGELVVGEIEPYPTFSVSQIETYLLALAANGATPSFIHIDADIAYLDRSPAINWAADLQALQAFSVSQGIPLGIIFWPGYNPISSDESYYNHTIDWVNRVYAAIGAPQTAIFEDWVLRAPADCDDTLMNCQPCSANDPSTCGTYSVPTNLPEGNPSIYSSVRLVDDALSVLRSTTAGAVPSLAVIGEVTGITSATNGNQYVSGWSCTDGLSDSTSVELFAIAPPGASGSVSLGTFLANSPSAASVEATCGTSLTNVPHGFLIPLTATQLQQYSGQPLYVQAISPFNRGNVILPTLSGQALLAPLDAADESFQTFLVPPPVNKLWTRSCDLAPLGRVAPTVSNRVAYLYCLIQARAADAGGLLNFTTLISNGTMTLQQFEDELFNSPGFISNFQVAQMSNSDFVTFLYRLLYFREPDAEGLTSFTNALNSKAITRQQIFDDMVTSTEYAYHNPILFALLALSNQQQILVPPALSVVTRSCGLSSLGTAPMSAESQVEYLYCLLQFRSADSGGLQSFSTALASGRITIQQVEDDFFTSAAFNERFPVSNMSNSDFVTFLYRLLYFEEPDAAGLATYTNALTSKSVTRPQLFNEMTASALFAADNPILVNP